LGDAGRLAGLVHAMDHLTLVQEDARSRPLEAADPEIAELPPVERDVQRPRASRDSRAVEELLVPARDLQEELPLARVPVERKKAGAARNVSNAVGDGWSLVRRLLRRLFRCRRRRRTGLLGRRSGRRGREQERREGEDSHFASRIGGNLTETLLSWDAYLEK